MTFAPLRLSASRTVLEPPLLIALRFVQRTAELFHGAREIQLGLLMRDLRDDLGNHGFRHSGLAHQSDAFFLKLARTIGSALLELSQNACAVGMGRAIHSLACRANFSIRIHALL